MKNIYRYRIVVKTGKEWLLTVQTFKSASKARKFIKWNHCGQTKEGKDWIIIKAIIKITEDWGGIDFSDWNYKEEEK